MQVVNDDMDELYRKAADNYPLDTDSADWDAVLKKLSEERSLNAGASKNKNYRHLLWLLLLIPLGLGLIYKNYFSEENKKSADTVSKNILNKNLTGQLLSNKTQPSNPVQNGDVPINTTTIQLKTSSIIHHKEKGKLHSFISENNSVTVSPGNLSSEKTKQVNEPERKEKEVVAEVSNKATTENKTGTTLKPENKTAENTINKEEATKNLQKKDRRQRESGLYAGIIISPDISTVKLQQVKKIGISMGIIAGYQVNKKVSIESGVSWSVKNYYSDGEYFKTNNIRMPAGAKINTVEGECKMIEVPLTVKYNFRSSGKKVLSVSAGVSSYFMKKESYDYDVSRNGQQYPYSSTYKNSSTDLLAVANFAVGYNRQIKKGTNLRIEPYIKVPVKGIGTGSLPITSTGLNIGVTKKISR